MSPYLTDFTLGVDGDKEFPARLKMSTRKNLPTDVVVVPKSKSYWGLKNLNGFRW